MDHLYKAFTKEMMLLEDADPMNPDVYVDGLGTYDLKTLKAKVRREMAEFAKMLETDEPHAWRKAHRKMQDGTFQAHVDAIVAAHDDLQSIRRKGGPRSRGIDKE